MIKKNGFESKMREGFAFANPTARYRTAFTPFACTVALQSDRGGL